jgi:protein TonB
VAAAATTPGVRLPVSAAYLASAALHVAAFVGLMRVDAHRLAPAEDVAVEIVEAVPPKAEPPAPAPPPPPREKIVRTPLRPPPDAPPPPKHRDDAPPPPNAPPPPDAQPVARAPVRIGISMSSSTAGGGFAAPVGNTLYGEMPKTAPSPADVKPYQAERYVPPTQVTVLPRPIGECSPPADEYPDEARTLGIEGLVVMMLSVDETGAVTAARVVEDPGHGLGPAAIASVRRHCRFEPAQRGGEKVATTLRYKVRYELP